MANLLVFNEKSVRIFLVLGVLKYMNRCSLRVTSLSHYLLLVEEELLKELAACGQ